VQKVFRRLLFQYWYFRQPPWDTGISPPELLEFIETHPPGRAIDIGCGTGTNVITLTRAGWRVTGVDFAPRAIALARQKIKREGLQADLSVNDATTLKGVAGLFDLALDIGCFHGMPQDKQADYLNQVDRILAPNGSWLMYGMLKPESALPGPGLTEADINVISTRLTPVRRQNGIDTTRGRSSAWFLFQKEAHV
jgi:cyclopropane fatty-acyl-phospholipid synthase-like methyltransferase